MPSTSAPAQPTLPTGSEVALKHPAYHSPIEKFIAAHEPSMIHSRQAKVWRADLVNALDWYAENYQRLRIQQRLLERREELAADFDGMEPSP